jgi:hypothetical protein
MGVFMEYSKDRQIVICTHSPYFICWNAIKNGANLIRTSKDTDNDIVISQLTECTKRKIYETLGVDLKGDFFGWGVGGAHKMEVILSILFDLGFKKIVALFDMDKKEIKEKLEKQFPDYSFFCIPTEDIRDKEERIIKQKNGITTSGGVLKQEYREQMKDLIESVNQIFETR